MTPAPDGAPAARPPHPFPLTDTQQAYLVGRGDLYPLGNVSTHAYLELEGPLDIGRFVRAWRLLVDRHPMLRAVIDPDRQEQQVLPEVPDPPIEIVDLRDRPRRRPATLSPSCANGCPTRYGPPTAGRCSPSRSACSATASAGCTSASTG